MTTQRRATALSLLATAALCFALAPMLMPESYSAVTHSVSESAAQGVEGAWLARLGFLLFGFGVLGLSLSRGEEWGKWGQLAHGGFGVSIIGAAAFSHMPWEAVPYDVFEDTLHSVVAFSVGMSFTLGVLLVTIRPGRSRGERVLDGIAITAAVAIPMVMGNVDGIAGLVQRTMFAIAILWYALETRPGRV